MAAPRRHAAPPERGFVQRGRHRPGGVLGTAEPVPGACRGAVFEQHPQTLLTGEATLPECPDRSHEVPPEVRIGGAWVYLIHPGSGIPVSDTARFTYGCCYAPARAGVHLADVDRTDTVRLSLVTSEGVAIITVGIGPDETVARTILHGLTVGSVPLGSRPRL